MAAWNGTFTHLAWEKQYLTKIPMGIQEMQREPRLLFHFESVFDGFTKAFKDQTPIFICVLDDLQV